MQVRMIVACCLIGMGSLMASAQMGATKEPAAGAVLSPAVAMDSQLSLIESEMMGVAKAMPAEKFGFAPSASIFVPGQATAFTTVRTFAQQVTHVAQANYFFFSMVSGLKPDVNVQALANLTSKDDVVAALAGSFAFGHKAIATLTPANAFESVKTPEPGVYTRASLAGFAVAHANDHYGQMIEYLRMNAIVPPGSTK